MTISADFHKFNPLIRMILIFILALTFLWCIAIHLFKHDFFVNEPFFIIVVYSLVLSCIFYGSNFVSYVFIKKSKGLELDTQPFFYAGVFSVLIMIASIVSNRFYFHLSFYPFVFLTSFYYLIKVVIGLSK